MGQQYYLTAPASLPPRWASQKTMLGHGWHGRGLISCKPKPLFFPNILCFLTFITIHAHRQFLIIHGLNIKTLWGTKIHLSRSVNVYYNVFIHKYYSDFSQEIFLDIQYCILQIEKSKSNDFLESINFSWTSEFPRFRLLQLFISIQTPSQWGIRGLKSTIF